MFCFKVYYHLWNCASYPNPNLHQLGETIACFLLQIGTFASCSEASQIQEEKRDAKERDYIHGQITGEH